MNKVNSALGYDEKRFIDDGKSYKFYDIDNLEKLYTNLHEHDFMEIFILLSGDITYVIEQGRFALKDFDILLVPPHTLHELAINDKSIPYKRLVLWIYPQYIQKLSTEYTNLMKEIDEFTKNGQYLIRNPEFTFTIKPYLEKIVKLQEEEKYGILNPLIVRPLKEGVYEIVSGHRRRFAAEKLGYRKVPVIIRVMRDEESVIAMVDANLQRERISYSEKAFAYKMKLEAIKHQGKKNELRHSLCQS